MFIINSGDPKKNAGSFHFSCLNCGCIWTAKRKEVSITPPCLPYKIYMKCPNCRKIVIAMGYEEQETVKKQEKEAWEYEYERMKDSSYC